MQACMALPCCFLLTRSQFLAREGSQCCLSSCSGQRWVGEGPPGSPQPGWTQGWEPVAIKMTPNTSVAKQELTSLQEVQQALKQLPGRGHVIQLLDSYVVAQSNGVSMMYIVTR